MHVFLILFHIMHTEHIQIFILFIFSTFYFCRVAIYVNICDTLISQVFRLSHFILNGYIVRNVIFKKRGRSISKIACAREKEFIRFHRINLFNAPNKRPVNTIAKVTVCV